MSLTTPVLGIDRSRVSLPSVFICQRRLKCSGYKNNNFNCLLFKVLQCIARNLGRSTLSLG